MTVYKINDLVKFDFIKIPKTLFANPKYKEMSSDAKLTYALLYDRLSLSIQNNWINADGEVYLVYTRGAIAEDLGITYKKAIAAFKELKENKTGAFGYGGKEIYEQGKFKTCRNGMS